MAISDTQKIDYLWKKVGFAEAKTETATNKIAGSGNETIPSPLQIRADKVLAQSSSIPTSLPASSTSLVNVYPTTTPLELPYTKVVESSTSVGQGYRGRDSTTTTLGKTWLTGFTDWISTEFGSTYAVRIFAHTSGSVASFSSFTAPQLAAIELTSGGTNEDQWFFDYQSGVLHFIGTNVPSDAANAAKSLYIVGGRYIGDFGLVPISIVGGTF